ncbi:MAG: ferritin family protein [Leptospiraceae bacterium]|nr:ferritin family protein [Leptospiraceae bacterium]
MKPIKETTFIEAIAAAIQKEKNDFEFYIQISDKLHDGNVKDLFAQIIEYMDENIKFIEEIYTQATGKQLPNLKQLSQIEKFHSSTIQKIMDKLDRNYSDQISDDELQAIQLALKEAEDTRDFYGSIRSKFKDPNLLLLFQKLHAFAESNVTLLEAQLMYIQQETTPGIKYYWEEELSA